MSKHPLRSLLMAAALAAMGGGCASLISEHSPAPSMAAATFIVVRHAEKAVDDPKDPTLSELGYARARQLGERLAGERVAAVYATGYRRTQLTAAPTAAAHRITTTTYDAGLPASEFAARLRSSHADGTVLVVGHSNTVAAIASALCNCEVAPVREDEFDRWISIRIGKDGKASVEQSRY